MIAAPAASAWKGRSTGGVSRRRSPRFRGFSRARRAALTGSLNGGVVWARAASGAVTGTRLASQRVDAQTLSGDVELDLAAAPQSVTASVASGSVDVTVPVGTTYRVSGRTQSGDRQIAAGVQDYSSPRQITIDTDSGDVALGYAGGS
ncbi:DUF4097 family beta strand repeat protein [Actinocrinis puniceicyclus]|uniref:DUF4097 family beta strand repeat protein n=1 Tax=Actinocrinis puniceicyclus TaxID=977794 RepID=A0A8J8BEZ4_9ACTN|nr:DUF4097 family beta strand repeat-containing protein [Actinocrinis puniceicyclus]MBS2965661.1 DUF4097 family beta strand repeat protein [Actinocrinis puniceicyclus]